MLSKVTAPHGCLPGAVVEVGVPRGPGAVEGKGELLVVLVLLTPHPKGGEHLSQRARQDALEHMKRRQHVHVHTQQRKKCVQSIPIDCFYTGLDPIIPIDWVLKRSGSIRLIFEGNWVQFIQIEWTSNGFGPN